MKEKKIALLLTTENEEMEVTSPLLTCSAFHLKRRFGTI